MDELSQIQKIAVWILPVIFAITVHEVAHGWMAKRHGDNTAWTQGRLTLNPFKHIDPIGTLLLPAILLLSQAGFVFGWAKPVPVEVRNLQHPKRDIAYVALAGPVANLLMALGWALIARLGVIINVEFISLPLIYTGIAGISINLVLGLLNLIPIPPLDGSRILTSLLPDYWAWRYNSFERYGFFVLLLLLVTDVLSMILGYPVYFLQNVFFYIAGLK